MLHRFCTHRGNGISLVKPILTRRPPNISRLHLTCVSRTANTAKSCREALSSVNHRLGQVSQCFNDIDDHTDWALAAEELDKLKLDTKGEASWNDDTNASLKQHWKLSELRKHFSTYTHLKSTFESLRELMSEASDDAQMLEDVLFELDDLQAHANEYLRSLWFSEPMDSKSAYIDIRAGSGGTEACDWASMLARMYTKWAHSCHFTVEVVDEAPGEVAGIKYTTLSVQGPYAYGYAQYESGVHRLVRISPFDKNSARHTSFASVQVSPQFDDGTVDMAVQLNPKDLKITTMRSQGAGGQHVNKTESAVRIVHIPTGITVSCQQDRSQHRNRSLALSLLQSKLYDIELQKRAREKAELHNSLPAISWGSQIRSYTLQPYRLVKDARTGHEASVGAVQGVLDGNLEGFMTASLRKFRRRQ